MSESEASDCLLCDWMEAHPGEEPPTDGPRLGHGIYTPPPGRVATFSVAKAATKAEGDAMFADGVASGRIVLGPRCPRPAG